MNFFDEVDMTQQNVSNNKILIKRKYKCIFYELKGNIHVLYAEICECVYIRCMYVYQFTDR